MTPVVSQLNNPVAGFDGTVKLPYLTYADNTVVRMVGHHVIPEEFFKNPTYAKFFEAIGFRGAVVEKSTFLQPFLEKNIINQADWRLF